MIVFTCHKMSRTTELQIQISIFLLHIQMSQMKVSSHGLALVIQMLMEFLALVEFITIWLILLRILIEVIEALKKFMKPPSMRLCML